MKNHNDVKWHVPKGFLFSGIHCGAKKKRKDLSLFYSNSNCKAAALFTRNTVKAAPVVVDIEHLARRGHIRAVVVNSGNANCMTGKRGLSDARRMVKAMAKVLGLKTEEVLVSSTGIIGQYMNMKPILAGMRPLALGLSTEALPDAADGIMTTDLFRKISSRAFSIGGKRVVITGVAKGAGMIKPDMATMLGYIMTDANISKKALDRALRVSADSSFNAITVDGDMSTNDTVVLMANGEAGNRLVGTGGRDLDIFLENLKAVSRDLSAMIVKDGEGASKFIEVRIKGAGDDRQAKKVAGAVADSLLVKCAVAGGDPNWGRVASSAGSSGVKFDPEKMDIKMDGVFFLKKGKACSGANRKDSPVFKGREVLIEINLNAGKGEAVFYSCDITKKYLAFNSFYTT